MKHVCSVLILVSRVTAIVTDEVSRSETVRTCLCLCRAEAGNFIVIFSKARTPGQIIRDEKKKKKSQQMLKRLLITLLEGTQLVMGMISHSEYNRRTFS